MDDKRSGSRWPSCLKGQVLSDDGRVIDCLVRDFSGTGARIEVPGSIKLPSTFELFFPLKQATFRAHVRWRGEKEIGLTFDNPEAKTPADPVQAKLLERLLQLEAENAELRQKMAQLTTPPDHAA